MEQDQFDTGERMLLNFGHTLAHTIEQHYHYTRESHGEAVAIGMYQITKIAEEMGLTKPGEAEHIRKSGYLWTSTQVRPYAPRPDRSHCPRQEKPGWKIKCRAAQGNW